MRKSPWCELTDGHAASWSSFSTPSCMMRMPSGGYCRASVMASSGVPRSQVANSRSQAALISVASNSWPMHSRPLWAACHASYADTPKPILLVDRARTFRNVSTVKAIFPLHISVYCSWNCAQPVLVAGFFVWNEAPTPTLTRYFPTKRPLFGATAMAIRDDERPRSVR